MVDSYTLLLDDNARPILKPGHILLLPIPHEKYTLRIVIPGTSPALNDAKVLRCNFPLEGEVFDRNHFNEYELNTEDLAEDTVVEIDILHSGAFSVEIGSTQWDFVVDLGFQLKGRRLGADSLCIQTVLSKLVDPGASVRSKKWRQTLECIAGKNYNMIHFVPLQPRGKSGSPYSVLDQLEWDKTTFPGGEDDVTYLVEQLEDIGILSLSDVVLNHTASDSPWLADNLDAGYSAKTAPHLQAAIELDSALFHAAIGQKVDNADALSSVVPNAVKEAAQSIRLWEFYVINVDETLRQAKHSDGPDPNISHLTLKEVAVKLRENGSAGLNTLGGRFSRSVDPSLLALYADYSPFSAKQILDEINSSLYAEYNADVEAAIAAVKDRQRYLRLDADGPQIGDTVTADAPLIETYFNREFGTPLACNGWVWGGDPLIDHAGPQSKAYIRRELIVWGDCTKLRYGNGPKDSPYLWKRMGDYAKLIAKYFSGIRLDNAHSTPLHVGEFILDEARKVRPNLYVVAELFSGSQEIDKLYVEKLGINSLLREAIMPGNPKDFSTVIHANGGLPIGSLIDPVLSGSPTHAWLMEVTHDNETMAQKRTVEDTLSTAGLVAMCQVASGSTFGSDETYGEALNVVSEERPYILGGGITDAKAVLNKLHREMAEKCMYESYTDYRGQYITVHRLSPETGEGVFLVARTKFWEESEQEIGDIKLEASKAIWGAGWSLIRNEGQHEDPHQIYQIPTELVSLDPIIAKDVGDGSYSLNISAKHFPPGSVAFWKTSRTFDAGHIENLVRQKADHALKDLNLVDLNELLYHIDNEERAATKGERGVYQIPDYDSLTYCGLEGWNRPVNEAVRDQNLGHPLCENLRQGLWAFEYIASRGDDRFKGVKEFVLERLELVKTVPSFLRPRYFTSSVQQLYSAATKRALELMGLDYEKTSYFFRGLALVSVQMVSDMRTCSLFPKKHTSTMAAGLPHFSEGVMRCWGRDVFLSVGGLLTELKRYDDFKQHVLGFGATLKYGLIPNLLDSGSNPRYNARDAVWFFAQSIQDFCKATSSLSLLDEKTQRRFPLDDSYTEQPTETFSSVGDLIYEILQRHAAGITFREHNAGPGIDMHMKSNGFNQHIWTDWSTGIVFGGNQDNCGTWQDKMGESPKAGNEGVPGTPRDGAAIEITAMLKSCLRWVNEVRRSNGYNWPATVKKENGETVSLEHWEELLEKNFERCYYIPDDSSARTADGKPYDVDWEIVNRTGIYKDLYRSGKPYEDYQLRANFPIAVLAAPELFGIDKISRTLKLTDDVLVGPVGIATLDPSDWNYHPFYINSDDSNDFATSKGRNYHQGPEWVWQFGVYLQALVQTLKRQKLSKNEIQAVVRNHVQGNVEWLKNSPYAGLTELTQKNGEICPDSSPTQAWSAARIIEAIREVNK